MLWWSLGTWSWMILDKGRIRDTSRSILRDSPRICRCHSLASLKPERRKRTQWHNHSISVYQSCIHFYIVLYHSINFYTFQIISIQFCVILSHSFHSISFYIIRCHSLSFIVILYHPIIAYNSISFYCILIIQFYIISVSIKFCHASDHLYHFLSIDDNVWLKRRILHRERGIGYS